MNGRRRDRAGGVINQNDNRKQAFNVHLPDSPDQTGPLFFEKNRIFQDCIQDQTVCPINATLLCRYPSPQDASALPSLCVHENAARLFLVRGIQLLAQFWFGSAASTANTKI